MRQTEPGQETDTRQDISENLDKNETRTRQGQCCPPTSDSDPYLHVVVVVGVVVDVVVVVVVVVVVLVVVVVVVVLVVVVIGATKSSIVI